MRVLRLVMAFGVVGLITIPVTAQTAPPLCFGRTPTIVATDDDGVTDPVYGTTGSDVMAGIRGHDKLYPWPPGPPNGWTPTFPDEGDFVCGDNGIDWIKTGYGSDRVSGGSGNDDIEGGPGPDQLSAGDGFDFVKGGPSNDRLFGGRGNDHLDGDQNDDYLDGGKGYNRLNGGSGYDTCIVDGSDDADPGPDILSNCEVVIVN